MYENESIYEPSVAQKVMTAILKHYGYSPAEFGAKVGYHKSTAFYDMLNGRTKKMSQKTAEIIKSVFPEIRFDFLITGRGSMFEEGTEDDNIEETDTSKVLLHLISVIQDQTKELQSLKEEVKSLKLYVANLQPMPAPKPYNYEERSRVISDGSTVKNENFK